MNEINEDKGDEGIYENEDDDGDAMWAYADYDWGILMRMLGGAYGQK